MPDEAAYQFFYVRWDFATDDVNKKDEGELKKKKSLVRINFHFKFLSLLLSSVIYPTMYVFKAKGPSLKTSKVQLFHLSFEERGNELGLYFFKEVLTYLITIGNKGRVNIS